MRAGPGALFARARRYLQLCAGDICGVLRAVHPAQVYHMLRRQALRG